MENAKDLNDADGGRSRSTAGLGGCAHDWQDDGDALQIVYRKCGERHDVDLSWKPGEVEAIVSQATGKRIGCVGHDCAECDRTRTALDVAMATLEQIATTPRNKGARRNAYSTLAFLRTQLTTPNDQAKGPGGSSPGPA